MRVGDARHGVGHARPGRHHGHAETAGQLGMGMGHVHGGALVADIDDADALGVDAHPHRHDVPAAQAEDPIDAARREETGHDSGGRVRGKMHRIISEVEPGLPAGAG